MSEMLRVKIEKYLVRPVELRWGSFGSEAERSAYLDDAVADLGRMDGEVITQALTEVRRTWKYPRRPPVAEFWNAAKSISKPKARGDGESAQRRACRVNDEAFRYAGEFVWNTPEGKASIAGGYAPLLREWVRVEAARQGFAGGPINVRIPASKVSEWQAQMAEAERLRDAPRPREPMRRLGQIAKQPHTGEAAE